MDETARFAEECAAGQVRRDNGISMAAIGVVVMMFGIVVPVRPNVTGLIGFALMVAASFMIASGRRKIRRALDGLVGDLQRH
ncbi:hypothetical protein [Sinomonas terrae]|uniref:Uncharacterized protein n=1 Tax=Sinomonas terrae TaxID=2908838 RepID=A0ABS9U5W6_9MICC|nr:hypothetical protein [Sinomonas terrae]MCH6471792.1 hypothetical protein [Sinomonas terrae]HKU09883.1 hypothetical protein [Sinomonas sp.]